MRMIPVFALLALAACPKPEPPPPPVVPPPVEEPADEGPATEEEAVEQVLRNFQRVHFEFDATSLSGGSLDALRQNADILQRYPRLRVEVQGHADERGTTEYNLALGQKRAKAILDQLTSMGVSAERLKKVSYGEERPLASDGSESAWSENRRAEFRVISSAETPVQGTVQ